MDYRLFHAINSFAGQIDGIDDTFEVLAAYVPFALIGVAIGLSRPVLGLHWPSDVVAGWAVALSVAGLVVTALARRPATAPASGD